MTDEQTSARAETEQLLARIAEVDPLLSSVCAVDPSALEQAAALDAEAAAGRRRSPLHGRPVLVKDNLDTAGLASTAGSLALASAPPATDSTVVARLREAGMVVLGKTNLSEWANIRDGRSTSGWSAVGGLTRNPYARNRTAWGSSSGSGAAVAARLAPWAIGTETAGSITAPSAACGCVGLKPTVGLLSTAGIVPISSSQDAPGPMALTVAGCAALLDVLAGTTTGGALGREVRGLRVGVPRGQWGASTWSDEAGERALGWLSAAGVEVVDVATPALDDFDDEQMLHLLLVELAHLMPGYLATRDTSSLGGLRDLADLVSFNRAHAEEELGWFGQSLFEQALELDGPASAAYDAARTACRATGSDELDRVLAEHRLDALLAPSTGPATPIDLVNGDRYLGGADTQSAAAGAPILTVPVGLAQGLPVAVSLWGARGSEETLLRLGRAVESGRDTAEGPLPEPTFPDFV